VNDLQTLFSVVFGIYFAATVGVVGRHNVFDTTAIAVGDLRALWRCLLGIVFIDLVPFFYFLGVLTWLSYDDTRLIDAWIPGIGVLFAGLSGFGIYRLFMATLLWKRPWPRTWFRFYSEPFEVREPARGHARRHNPTEPLSGESEKVFWGGFVWLVMCFSIFLGTT
jgi:hypothetical protein